MKKVLSLFLAALLAAGCISATAATFDGTGDLSAVIAQAQAKTEAQPDADDVVELTRDSYLYSDATVKENTTLRGDSASRVLTVDNATLTIENNAKVENLSIRLQNNAVLRLYGRADLSGLKGLTVATGAKVQYLGVNGKGASSFAGTPKVDGATVTAVTNQNGNATGEYTATVKKGQKIKVTLTGNAHLPEGAILLLGNNEPKSTGGNAGARTFTYEVTPSGKTSYAIRTRVGNVEADTVNTLTLYAFDTAEAKVERSNVSASMVIGQISGLFNITLPEGFTVSASVEKKYSDALSIDAAGKVTALKPLDNAEVDFDFVFTYPDGTKSDTITRTIRGLTVSSPVSGKDSASVYVNQLTKIFDITMPTGYAITSVKTDCADVIVSEAAPGSITALKTMTRKNVKFTFTFQNEAARNNQEGGNTFTVEKTVAITATVYHHTYPVTVTAPKTYLSVGEIVQLSVPYESIGTATSSNPSVASVDGSGRVTGRGPGQAIIYVYTPGGGYGSIQVTVTGSSTYVTAPKTTITVDETMQLTVPGDQIVAASSANSRIIAVDNSGRVQGIAPGTTTVYVSTAMGRGASIQLTVTSKPISISGPSTMTVGQSSNITVLGDSILSASSSNTSVVMIYGNSMLYARSAGTAVITVTTSTGRTGTLTVTVQNAYTPDPTPSPVPSGTKTIKVGGSTTLKVSGDTVISAYSSNTAVATVTSSGRVTGVSAGTAIVTVYTATGRTGSITINVTGSTAPSTSSKTLKVDQSMTLRIKGKTIIGASLEKDNGTISVTRKGKVTALNEGTDTVLLVTSDNKVVRVKVTVRSRDGEIDCRRNVRVVLRKTASSKGKAVAKLSDGTELTILGRSGSYYRVEAYVGSRTYTGYVLRSYVDKW